MTQLSVIGAGAWGTTVANILADNGHSVRLWCHNAATTDTINTHHRHHRLPDVSLNPSIVATTTMASCYDADAVVLGLSSRQLQDYATVIDWNAITGGVIVLAKGMMDNQHFIPDWLAARFSGPIAVLSGPNLALEIAQKKPSASVIASKNASFMTQFQSLISNHYFRAYTSSDVQGVTGGGVFKNVFAIAAGCLDALQLGENAKAALITRGLVELTVLVTHFGGRPETAQGLSGLGDLLATCSSPQSRNWQLGSRMILHPNDVMADTTRGETEGIRTIQFLQDSSIQNSRHLPIISSIQRLFFDQSASPHDIIQELMERGLKSEFDHPASFG